MRGLLRKSSSKIKLAFKHGSSTTNVDKNPMEETPEPEVQVKPAAPSPTLPIQPPPPAQSLPSNAPISPPAYSESAPAGVPTQLPQPQTIPPNGAGSAPPASAPVGVPDQLPKTQTGPLDGIGSALEGSAPVSLDATENEELRKVWMRVQDRVRQLAEREQKDVNDGMKIGDVIDNLNAAQEKKQKSPKAQAIKTAFGRTMGLIKTVGGIVADGASTVFAPAGQCYNVISFLINAYDGYQGAFEGLADLLEKCSDHLGRLEYYVRGGMDKRLSSVAASQLKLFVDICDAALKMRYSKLEKFVTGMKIAFLQESSIQELLGLMGKLQDREISLVSAQTFSLASEAATNAAEGAAFGKEVLENLALKDADEKERSEKEADMAAVTDVLAFDQDPERWDNSRKEPVQWWQRRYNDIRKDVVSDTGKWLLDNTVFQSWERDFASSPILGIEGADISGKTYLTSSVVKHLRADDIAEHAEFRDLVAFYFLDRENHNHGFDAMAKSLVWQLADKDEPYMKSASRISRKVKALDPVEIIPRLLLENEELEHMDAVFYLLIDGLGDILDDGLLNVLRRACKSRNSKIRILITGTPRAFEQIKKNDITCRIIPISPSNQDDVDKFIDAEMDKFDALSDKDRAGVPERREEIREKLSQAAAGDFYKLSSALNTISTLDYMDDINRVIHGAGTERTDQIREEVKTLNRVRSPRQINEINKIILWITFGMEPVAEKHISAVLYMTIREAPLRPLAERFRTKYLLFEVDSKGFVGFRSRKAPRAIPHRSALATSKNDSLNDEEVQQGEVDIVLHFLDKVCPPRLCEKLDIKEYLQQKKSHNEGQIQQEDKDTGNVLLALDCLAALTEGPKASISVLQEYARKHLIRHLSKVDLAMVDREQKSKVGVGLVRLLTREECIDALMWPAAAAMNTSHKANISWLEDSQNVVEVVRWLKDTAVLSGVSDESSQSWMNSAMSGNSFEILLKPSVVRMASHCLREPLSYDDTWDTFQFAKQYVAKVVDRPAEEQSDSATRFEQWALEALQPTDQDTLWHTQMAMIYDKKSMEAEALERSKQALVLDPNNWRASLCLARASPPEGAIEALNKVISHQQSSTTRRQSPSWAHDLANLNYELGDKYWDIGQHDLAIEAFTASIRFLPGRLDRAVSILTRFSIAQKWTAIVDFIWEMAKADEGEQVGEMAIQYAGSPKVHQMLHNAAIESKQYGIVDTVYKPAIYRASKTNDHRTLFLVRYHYGTALYEHPNRREDKVIRLWEAAVKEDFPFSGLDPDDQLPDIYAGLGVLYLKRALIANVEADPDSVTDYLGKISDMVPEEVSQSQLFIPPKLYIARFHYVKGEYAIARKTVRTLVQVALELLSDGDEGNDIEALEKLLFVFVPLNDVKNAATVITFMTVGVDPDHGTGKEYNLRVPCTGPCKYRWTVPSGMWLCQDCISNLLEGDCLQKIRDGKLERNICDSQHSFMEVPPWDGERMRALPKGTVPWGEQQVTFEEWKQKVREEYVDLEG